MQSYMELSTFYRNCFPEMRSSGMRINCDLIIQARALAHSAVVLKLISNGSSTMIKILTYSAFQQHKLVNTEQEK